MNRKRQRQSTDAPADDDEIHSHSGRTAPESLVPAITEWPLDALAGASCRGDDR
jgi:hypothetical protein